MNPILKRGQDTEFIRKLLRWQDQNFLTPKINARKEQGVGEIQAVWLSIGELNDGVLWN